MDFLYVFHSHFRWIVVLISLIVLLKFLYGWLIKSDYNRIDQILVRIYAGVIDLQMTFGLVYLIWSGLDSAGFPRYRLEHSFLMIIVTILAHLFGRWKTAASVIRFRNGFLIILLSLVLIFIAVLMLPGGMSRWIMGA